MKLMLGKVSTVEMESFFTAIKYNTQGAQKSKFLATLSHNVRYLECMYLLYG